MWKGISLAIICLILSLQASAMEVHLETVVGNFPNNIIKITNVDPTITVFGGVDMVSTDEAYPYELHAITNTSEFYNDYLVEAPATQSAVFLGYPPASNSTSG